MISTAKLSHEPWGALPDGRTVHQYTLRNAHGMRVSVSELGATLVSWHAPDRAGRLGDILLGHDTPADYWEAKTYMGALVGRWANRIAGGRFTLDGVAYQADRNEGDNSLHGGRAGFNRAIWQAREEGGTLVLTLDSKDGDAGFPGNVHAEVRYALDDDGELTIDYRASTDAPTPLNLTSHGYFNLSGQSGTDIKGHVLSIDADAFFEVDPTLIPIRESAVAGNAFDFREPAPIGARLEWPHEQLSLARGFDHCYVLRETNAAARSSGERPVCEVARLYDPASGRFMTVSTDQRGLQFYTGNYLDGVRGRQGTTYARHAGLCLEAGGFPNQINMADREDVISRPEKPYRQVTKYRVGVRD
ncbi:aldose epimerase family protein [Trinickia dinghuensis]|uniref:Aldose 1-epimerase n=1 Tax=Trinickia dinghuensis TaxID=2291023 RepID=A0A3D8K0M4_9BURK|nr:aldose epimerase family protein [Trinickia dinghuensis]RDU98444.1 galactose mutarotase [Trinickia dinghuensis]